MLTTQDIILTFFNLSFIHSFVHNFRSLKLNSLEQNQNQKQNKRDEDVVAAEELAAR